MHCGSNMSTTSSARANTSHLLSLAGEVITATVEVTSVTQRPLHTATCTTIIRKADGSIATSGEAVVMLPQPVLA